MNEKSRTTGETDQEDRRRVLGRITLLGFGGELGSSSFALFPSIFPERTVQIDSQELKTAGVEPRIGTRFFAMANLAAATPEEVRPSDFEPINPADLEDLQKSL